MRIMLVSQDRERSPAVSGTTNKLYDYLKKNGHEVLFYVKGKTPTSLYLLNFPKFIFNYLKFKPDIVVSYHQIGFIPALLWKLGLLRKKLIHGWWDAYTEVAGRKYSPSFLAFIEYFNIKNCDLVITNSKWQASVCRNLNIQSKWFMLGVEDYFLKTVKKSRLPGTHSFKLLYVGELNDYKRTDSMISAVGGLAVDLIVIGDVDEKLKKNAPKNVHFMGLIKHSELPSYVKSADVVLIPSDQDGSLKMYEYLALGKCILAFKGRIGYVLTHGENAFLSEDLKEGILALVKDSSLRKRLETGASSFGVKRLEKVFDEYISTFKEVLRS